MIKKALILSLFICLFLCGCGGYREIDEQYMISALGFSYGGSYTVYAETVSIGTDSTTATPRVFKGQGDTIQDAYSDLQRSFAKGAMLGHCAAIILDKNLDSARKKEVFDFCIYEKSINLSACTAKSGNIEKLLSATSETAAVGYDIYSVQKKQKSKQKSELYNYLSGKIKSPLFENINDSATETEDNDAEK